MNILDPLGFSYAVELMLRGEAQWPGALGTALWHLGLHVPGKHRKVNDDAGRRDTIPLADADVITIRVTLLILIVMAKGCTWVVEQPASSVM